MRTEELIERAVSVLNPVMVDDRLFGDVGAALVTEQGNVYTGVCVDTGGWGLCAERSAIAAMITAGEYRIATIVAVWREWRGGLGPVYIAPPCGICRDFMRQVDPGNLDTEVVIELGKLVKLRDLLPHGEFSGPVDV